MSWRPPGVRLLLANRMRRVAGVCCTTHIHPAPTPRPRSDSASCTPRAGRHTPTAPRWATGTSPANLRVEPLEELLAIVPTHLLHRVFRPLEPARVAAHHRLPLLLRHRIEVTFIQQLAVGRQPVQDALGVVEPVHAEQYRRSPARPAPRGSLGPGSASVRLAISAKPAESMETGNVAVADLPAGRRAAVRCATPPPPVGGRLSWEVLFGRNPDQRPVVTKPPLRRQARRKLVASLCALESEQVRAEQALHDLPAPGQLGEDLVARERDVGEVADAHVGSAAPGPCRGPAGAGSRAPIRSRRGAACSADRSRRIGGSPGRRRPTTPGGTPAGAMTSWYSGHSVALQKPS